MIDYSHILKDAGLFAASAAGQVDSEDKIVNVGAGRLEGKMVVDVTAIEIDCDNELYTISLQGSTRPHSPRRSRTWRFSSWAPTRSWAAMWTAPPAATRCRSRTRRPAPSIRTCASTAPVRARLQRASIFRPTWRNIKKKARVSFFPGFDKGGLPCKRSL